MAKKIMGQIKLQIQAGKANPAPPVGPALGQRGVNIMEFCKAFNAATSNMGDMIIPVIITVYEDRSFTFVTKTPPTSDLIKKELNLSKGSSKPGIENVGKLTMSQLEKIAKIKLPDLNTDDLEKAKKIVTGTSKSVGVTIEEKE
ncbi:MAG: 50S ribosomal protein L11 [Deferribacterota bacterium]|nr:50S ribosomal protein L11 [Deferribacterota bacterium]